MDHNYLLMDQLGSIMPLVRSPKIGLNFGQLRKLGKSENEFYLAKTKFWHVGWVNFFFVFIKFTSSFNVWQIASSWNREWLQEYLWCLIPDFGADPPSRSWSKTAFPPKWTLSSSLSAISRNAFLWIIYMSHLVCGSYRIIEQEKRQNNWMDIFSRSWVCWLGWGCCRGRILGCCFSGFGLGSSGWFGRFFILLRYTCGKSFTLKYFD